MKTEEKKSKKWIIMLVIFLFLSVVISTTVYFDKLKDFIPNDDGAIDLVDKDNVNNNNSNNNNTSNNNANGNSNGGYNNFKPKPGFEVSDENGIWSTETDIEIFKVSYENGETQMTILSNDGDKVIAPGSENSYTFKLRNLGNVPLDYTLNVDAYITPGDIEVPIELRLNRFDGKWISGNNEEWVDTSAFNEVSDEYTLGTSRFSWYTLDWKWVFEDNRDEFDTYLGNLAVDGDITVTVKLSTTATISKDFGGGHMVPTGDGNNVMLYVACGGMALIAFLLLLHKKDDEA